MILFTISGRDKPGVSAALFEQLGKYPIAIVDVQQVVINQHLCLGVHVSGDNDLVGSLLADVTRTMRSIDMSVDIEFRDAADALPHIASTHSVVILGQPIHAGVLSSIASTLADFRINIDTIHPIADYPLTGLELLITIPTDQTDLPLVIRKELATIALQYRADIAIEQANRSSRTKRLIVFDVDSTLIQGEVIEMLAHYAGTESLVADITTQAMAGEIDFSQSLLARVETLAGLDASVLSEISQSIQLTPGAKTTIRTLKNLGYKIGLVSGGFYQVIDEIAQQLGVDYVKANNLEIIDGKLTGRVEGEIVDRQAKARALEEFATRYYIPLEQTVAVGDGANDIDMLSQAGMGIAFCAKPALTAVADASLNFPYLDCVLFLLGLTRVEIEALNTGYDIRV